MKVIFNADDFGLTAGVNRGIIAAYKRGLLTSTSLISSGEAAEEAMDLALENPGLDTGIHLVLTDEPPLLSTEVLPTVDTRDGFLPSRNRLLRSILTRKIDYKEVAREWRAQVEKPLGRGINISHIDSHQFVHLFPGLCQVCLEIAQHYHIPFIRNIMIEPSLSKRLFPKIGLMRLLQWLGLWGWTRLTTAGGRFPLQKNLPSVGFLNAGGRMSRIDVLQILDTLSFHKNFDCVEIFLHPGLGDDQTHGKYKHWNYLWENDLNLLMDEDLRKGLEKRNIKTISFKNQN